jgi:glyoxylase-like metal-dependent hydrolase (beta-lactamase superfamily II)
VFITGFPAGSWSTNCYVLATGPGEPCLIVDPGQDSIDGVHEIVRENRLRPAAVILTHGHMDHVWSVAPVSRDFEIPAMIHTADRYRLADPAGSSLVAAREQLLAMTKDTLELTEPSDVQLLPADGVQLELAGITLGVRHAPGHTEGSVVFDVPLADGPDLLLSGDVLFQGSIGRTDLPGGDPQAMDVSLREVIWPMDDETVVLPGHGGQTTIAAERAANPFLQAAAAGGTVEPPRRGW